MSDTVGKMQCTRCGKDVDNGITKNSERLCRTCYYTGAVNELGKSLMNIQPMKTKAEILQSYLSCTCDSAYKIRNLTDPDCALCNNEDQILEAMSEYAKQEAQEFAEWIDNNAYSNWEYFELTDIKIPDGKWVLSDKETIVNISELYTKFDEERGRK